MQAAPASPVRVVATTRARPESPQALAPLVAAGARVVHVPLVRQELVEDAAAVTAALLEGPERGWSDVLLTSANGVRALGRALERAQAQGGPDREWLRGRSVWAIGPATARALEAELGVPREALVPLPARFTAAALVARAAQVGVRGRRFLYPAAAQARPELPDGLRALGARVHVAVGYDTVPHPEAAAGLAAARTLGLGLVLLASPSAARALIAAWGDAGALPDVGVIGPTTARAARQGGLHVTVEAQESTMRGLCLAVARAEPPQGRRLGSQTAPGTALEHRHVTSHEGG